MPPKILIQAEKRKKAEKEIRPEFNSNYNSSYVKRTDEEYKAEVAKIKASK